MQRVDVAATTSGEGATKDSMQDLLRLHASSSPTSCDALLQEARSTGTAAAGKAASQSGGSIQHVSGVEALHAPGMSSRFPADRRLEEAGRLLDTSEPQPIKPPLPPMSSGDPQVDIQYTLWAMARRTLATPIGRGALTVRAIPARRVLSPVPPFSASCSLCYSFPGPFAHECSLTPIKSQ